MRKENNTQVDREFTFLTKSIISVHGTKNKTEDKCRLCVLDSTQNPNTSSYKRVLCPRRSVSVMHLRVLEEEEKLKKK